MIDSEVIAYLANHHVLINGWLWIEKSRRNAAYVSTNILYVAWKNAMRVVHQWKSGGYGGMGMMIECQVCTHEKCKGKGRECGISINELFMYFW